MTKVEYGDSGDRAWVVNGVFEPSIRMLSFSFSMEAEALPVEAGWMRTP